MRDPQRPDEADVRAVGEHREEAAAAEREAVEQPEVVARDRAAVEVGIGWRVSSTLRRWSPGGTSPGGGKCCRRIRRRQRREVRVRRANFLHRDARRHAVPVRRHDRIVRSECPSPSTAARGRSAAWAAPPFAAGGIGFAAWSAHVTIACDGLLLAERRFRRKPDQLARRRVATRSRAIVVMPSPSATVVRLPMTCPASSSAWR